MSLSQASAFWTRATSRATVLTLDAGLADRTKKAETQGRCAVSDRRAETGEVRGRARLCLGQGGARLTTHTSSEQTRENGQLGLKRM